MSKSFYFIFLKYVFIFLFLAITTLVSAQVNLEMVLLPNTKTSNELADHIRMLKQKYGDKITSQIYFFVKTNKQKKVILGNGSTDLKELKRLAIIRKHYPEQLDIYMSARSSNQNNPIWQHAIQYAGIELGDFENKLKTVSNEKMFRNDINFVKQHNLSEAPFLFLNGQLVSKEEMQLYKLDSLVQYALEQKKELHEITLVIDPNTIESVKHEYVNYLNTYCPDSIVVEKNITLEIEKGFLKHDIQTVPVVLVDKKFTESFYKHYIQNHILIEDSQKYSIPVLHDYDAVLGRTTESNKIKLYIQPFCPYAISLIKQLMEKGRTQDLLFPGYILQRKMKKSLFGGQYVYDSLHGPEEVEEAIRQTVIQNNYPDKFWKYIDYLYSQKKSDWKIAVEKAGVDSNQLLQLVKKDYKQIAESIFNETSGLKLYSSPTVLIDNRFLINDINAYFNKEKIKIEGRCQ